MEPFSLGWNSNKIMRIILIIMKYMYMGLKIEIISENIFAIRGSKIWLYNYFGVSMGSIDRVYCSTATSTDYLSILLIWMTFQSSFTQLSTWNNIIHTTLSTHIGIIMYYWTSRILTDNLYKKFYTLLVYWFTAVSIELPLLFL